MLLHSFQTLPNFGDALNPWLWPKLLPGRFSDDDRTVFLGIGTLPPGALPAAERYLVFGAGVNGDAWPPLDARWEFQVVRGPLTATALGLPEETAVTDSAYLLAFVDLPPPHDGGRIGFMPHYRSLRRIPWRVICELAGLRFINPLAPVDSVIADLRGCDCLISESLHGAIVADLLRVPWLPVRLGRHFCDFKWRDWFAAMGMGFPIIPLQAMDPWTRHRLDDSPRARTARRIVNLVGYYSGATPLTVQLRRLRHGLERKNFAHLSTNRVFRDRLSTLERRLDALRESTEPAGLSGAGISRDNSDTATNAHPTFGTAPSRV